MSTRIDAHQHFWQPARADYAWLRSDDPALAALIRDFMPEHLQGELQVHRIGRTVLVQAADSLAETEFLLDLAARHDVVAGVVGWVDLAGSYAGWVAVSQSLIDEPAPDQQADVWHASARGFYRLAAAAAEARS